MAPRSKTKRGAARKKTAEDLIREAAENPELTTNDAGTAIMRHILSRMAEDPLAFTGRELSGIVEGLAALRKADPDEGVSDPLLREFINGEGPRIQTQAVVPHAQSNVSQSVHSGSRASGGAEEENRIEGQPGGGLSPEGWGPRGAGGSHKK